MPPNYHPTQYAVLEHSDHEHNRLQKIKASEELAAQGKLVFQWPDEVPETEAKVLVYAVPVRQ
jgi:hypothetical protein